MVAYVLLHLYLPPAVSRVAIDGVQLLPVSIELSIHRRGDRNILSRAGKIQKFNIMGKLVPVRCCRNLGEGYYARFGPDGTRYVRVRKSLEFHFDFKSRRGWRWRDGWLAGWRIRRAVMRSRAISTGTSKIRKGLYVREE